MAANVDQPDKPASAPLAKFIDTLFEQHPDLLGVLLTDAEGIPMLFQAREDQPELACDPNVNTHLVQATDNLHHIGFCTPLATLSQGERFQYVHFNCQPIQCLLIAELDANLGRLLALKPQFEYRLQPVRTKVARLTSHSIASSGFQD
ncbi:Ragulator complex protein lamtor3 [Tieghemiomyces parasiticus]|uniref:Ragulator complex protein lamtor3 n=1 Tax=Tieghemiomyces parasiticus TaxID=78921 RepID=A0A9W8A910_9FUNG|nr:Ragulator complex protein lamtor3 [Tieghemiomyces parasiticus]